MARPVPAYLGWFLLAFLGCHRPSNETRSAFLAAQVAAAARLSSQERAFATSIQEVRAGKWVPADGGCTAQLPDPPKEDDGWRRYTAWVMDDPDPAGIAGWSHLEERIFKRAREEVLTAADVDRFDTEEEIGDAVRRLQAMDPSRTEDIPFLFVDELHRPVQTGEGTFAGGDERGRAWVWSASRKTIVCASTFASETPRKVLIDFFLAPQERSGEVDSGLMLGLRRQSVKSAIRGLTQAGPPR